MIVEAEDKTKEELLGEMAEMRRRIAELETLATEYRQAEAERERLLATEREQRVLAEALHWAGAVLGSTLNYEKVLDHIMEQIGRIMTYKAACVMLVEGKTVRVFRWCGYNRFGATDSLDAAPFSVNDIPSLRVIQDTGWPVAVPYVTDYDEWVAKSGQDWIKSYLNASIRTRTRLIGFLHVDSDTPGLYSQADAERLQTFANQVAIALENARRYDRARQEIARRVKELKKERNFVSAILDTVGALVVVLNKEGRIVRFNRACEQMTGYSVDEVIGSSIWSLFPASEDMGPLRTMFKELQNGQFPSRYENHWIKKDGEPRLIAWSNTALFDHNSVEYIVGTGIDITRRRRSEEEREKLIEELDAFAHTVAHDLKGPAGLMISFADALMECYNTLSEEELQKYLHSIVQNGRKMSNIVNELLLLAGVRKQEVELSPLDMAAIVAEARQRLVDVIEEYQAEIILPETWPVALGYDPWIEEVWVNYLSNALKYGGQPPRVELGATGQAGGMVRFWIRDNGIGLSPEDQASLFTPFTRLNQVRTAGQGLGLSIVRRILEKLGGQVGVESDGLSGQGSVFSFYLPVSPDIKEIQRPGNSD